MAGISPNYKAWPPFRDFLIYHEGDKGLEGLINLTGIESSGLKTV